MVANIQKILNFVSITCNTSKYDSFVSIFCNMKKYVSFVIIIGNIQNYVNFLIIICNILNNEKFVIISGNEQKYATFIRLSGIWQKYDNFVKISGNVQKYDNFVRISGNASDTRRTRSSLSSNAHHNHTYALIGITVSFPARNMTVICFTRLSGLITKVVMKIAQFIGLGGGTNEHLCSWSVDSEVRDRRTDHLI